MTATVITVDPKNGMGAFDRIECDAGASVAELMAFCRLNNVQDGHLEFFQIEPGVLYMRVQCMPVEAERFVNASRAISRNAAQILGALVNLVAAE